ncbi:hypothetical protein DUI87_05937 [Hirundo rustica rustica]|uniref:Uncharacterized protein n=1 Tax=Hirundo rustica rustica TaxID=333673 RepID=A0A3M0KX18_HIRRU|nr:hypothetical protein DUI87_05937 [Hirundo rustica rustica]
MATPQVPLHECKSKDGKLKSQSAFTPQAPIGKQDWNNSIDLYGLGADLLGSSSLEKDLEVLMDNKLLISQQCVLVAMKVKGILGCIGKSIASKSQEMIPSFYSALLNAINVTSPSLDIFKT